jgi:hypothetical protein
MKDQGCFQSMPVMFQLWHNYGQDWDRHLKFKSRDYNRWLQIFFGVYRNNNRNKSQHNNFQIH